MENEIELRKGLISIIEQHSQVVGINGRYYNATPIDNNGGRGRFSLVFRAEDRTNGSEVALKFFNPMENDDYRRKCFYRESAILSSLSGQPNILQIVEPRTICSVEMIHGPTGLKWPLPIEFISTSLARSNVGQYIVSTRNDAKRNLVFFREMCKAVQRIHSRNIRHRDLKPDNFFIVGSNNICLGDFGSARNFGDGGIALEETYPPPFWRGDLPYTAPEVFGISPESAEMFRRADIYSLGTILFEMFTKRPLYLYVFNDKFNDELTNIVKYGTRKLPLSGESLSQIVVQIIKDNRLPDIYDFYAEIPEIISNRLNNLYKGLCNLDSSQRYCDFQYIFNQIDRCIDELENQKKYERLKQYRQRCHDRHIEKMEERRRLSDIHNQMRQQNE